MEKFFKNHFPIYLRFWPTNYWLCAWSAPDYKQNETGWGALRITIRQGEHHSHIVSILKSGIV